MKPAPFLYERPTSVEETVALLREHGDEAKVLAGGQSLVPLLNLRLSRPAVLVDINRVEGLDRHEGSTRGGDRTSARLRWSSPRRPGAALRRPPRHPQPRHDRWIDRPRRRERGAAALSASCSTGPCARRPAASCGVRSSSSRTTRRLLEPDELLLETTWPQGGAVGFAEFALRHGDFALAACACSLGIVDGTIVDARVGVGAVVERPTLLELDLAGAPATPETAREAGGRATAVVDPFGNQHATAAYLRSLTGTVVERALTQAFGQAAA